MVFAFVPQVPIGQNNTTTSVAALIEKMSSLDTDINNLECKFEIVTVKRKVLEDKKKTEPKPIVVTKTEDREKTWLEYSFFSRGKGNYQRKIFLVQFNC